MQEFFDPKFEGLSIRFASLRLGLFIDTNNTFFRPAVRTRQINQIEHYSASPIRSSPLLHEFVSIRSDQHRFNNPYSFHSQNPGNGMTFGLCSTPL
jgi:hypothetical protein